jgi:tRNA 2-thiouridine synthesizing protein A
MSEPVVLDLRGLKCPLPVLKTAQRMKAHPAGTRFLVLSTDPMAAIDIPHFCAEQGHVLITTAREVAVFRFEIEKAPTKSPAG